jgi:glycosyltransferase involved in cell wall biosynthesis
MRRRAVVVTAGHLSTCPRMLKAAEALVDAGYDVRVVSTTTGGWMSRADEQIRRRGRWRSTVVDYGRSSGLPTWLWSGVRFKSASRVVRETGGRVIPRAAFGRVHGELVRAIEAEPADFIYGGTSGAIAATAEAGRRLAIPFAVDFEDFHCGEHVGADEAPGNAIGRAAMRAAATGAAFVTAGSQAIAEACETRLGIAATPIHNVFPRPDREPEFRPANRDEFRVYWFSQTIGPDRGIEDMVRALGRAPRAASLNLRGVAVPGYLAQLGALRSQVAPALTVRVLAPTGPDRMVDDCRAFDLGLASEQASTANRALCLSNKAATYPLAGLPVAITETPGQRRLAEDLGEGALRYEPGDVEGLCAQVSRLMADERAYERACRASWHAGTRRWYWEHESERGRLLQLVEASCR